MDEMDSLHSMLHDALNEASETDSIAIETHDCALTYRVLKADSANLAHFLAQQFVRGGGAEL